MSQVAEDRSDRNIQELERHVARQKTFVRGMIVGGCADASVRGSPAPIAAEAVANEGALLGSVPHRWSVLIAEAADATSRKKITGGRAIQNQRAPRLRDALDGVPPPGRLHAHLAGE
jgi:hypothetical protein